MSGTIIKPKPDEDFYVVYSSVVDSPTHFGTREQLACRVRGVGPERLDRADATGTSAMWSDPPEHGWADETIMVREGIEDPTRQGAFWGEVKREDLREFCESIRNGLFCPRPGLVRWIADPDV